MPSRSRSPRRLSLRWAAISLASVSSSDDHDGDALGQILIGKVDVGLKVRQSPRQTVAPTVVEPASSPSIWRRACRR